MINVASYIKNLGKSVVYSSVDIVGDIAPSSTSMISTNQELFKEVYHSIRDYKMTLKRTAALFGGSKVYEAADVGFNAILEDVASGKFYNKDRESEMMMSSNKDMFDMSDMDISADGGFDDSAFNFDDMGNDDNVDISAGDALVAKSVSSSSRSSAEMISHTIARTAKASADSQRISTNILYAQNAKLMGNLNSGIMDVASGVNSLFKFSTTTVQAHAENSKLFFENSTGLMQEQVAILKEMVEMQRNDYKERQDAKPKDPKVKAKGISFDDIVDSNGMPDIKKYFESVTGNAKEMMSNYGGDMLFGGDGNMLLNFVSNPLKALPDMLVKSVIGPGIMKAGKELDKSISGIFGIVVAKLNKAAKGGDDGEGSLISQMFGKLFGVKDRVKSSLETGNYEKGPVPFDGLAKKALTDVIPTYLRKIVSLLSGKSETIFDYKTGKWEDGGNIKKKIERTQQSNVTGAFSDMADEMGKHNSRLTFDTRQQKTEYYKDFEKILKKIYSDGGAFEPNSNRPDKHNDYGVSEANMKMLDKMFNKISKSTANTMAGNVINQRSRENRAMTDLEQAGGIEFEHYNNSNINEHLKFDKQKNIIGSNGVMGSNDITLKLDNKGHNLFYYLQNMYEELSYMRRFGTGVGGEAAYSKTGAKMRIETATGSREIERSRPTIDSVAVVNDARPTADQRHREINADDKHVEYEMKRRAREKERGRSLGRIDQNAEDKDNILSASVAFQDSADDLENRKHREALEDMPWIYRVVDDEVRENRAKDAKTLSGSKAADTKGFLNKLLKAETLGEKYALIRDGLDDLTASPSTLITKVLTQADQNIYDFFYGKESDVRGDDNKKIHGFFDRMVHDMTNVFKRMNNWVDENILSPIKKKMDAETLGGAFKNGLKAIGIDTDAIQKNAKEFFEGLVSPTRDAIKEAFSNAFSTTKSALADVYNPLKELINGEEPTQKSDLTIDQMTEEQKSERLKGVKAKANVSELDIIKELIQNQKNSGQSDRDASIANHSALIQEHTAKLQEAWASGDVDGFETSSKQVTKSQKAKAALERKSASYDDRIKEFEQNQLRQNEITEQLKTHQDNATDTMTLAARSKRQTELSGYKKIIGADDAVNIKNVSAKKEADLTSAEKNLMNLKNDPKYAKIFNQIEDLEDNIPILTTTREKLQKEIQELESRKAHLYKQSNTSKEAASNAFNYAPRLQEQADSSKDDLVDAWNSQDQEKFDTATNNKNAADKTLSDYNKLIAPKKEKKELDKTGRAIRQTSRMEKVLGTKDIMSKLLADIRLGEHNLSNSTDEKEKSKLAKKLERKKNTLNLASNAKNTTDKEMHGRVSEIFKRIGLNPNVTSEKELMDEILGMNVKDLDNLKISDIENKIKDSKKFSNLNWQEQDETDPSVWHKSNIVDSFIREHNISKSADDSEDKQDSIKNILNRTNFGEADNKHKKLALANSNGLQSIVGTESNTKIGESEIAENEFTRKDEEAEKLKEEALKSNKFLGSINTVLSDKLTEMVTKLDGILSAIGSLNIGGHAEGARYIEKSGLTAISEGEMIIPSEMNPLNPNRDKVDKQKEIRNEKKIKDDFSKSLSGNIYDSIRENAEGKETIPPADGKKPNAIVTGINNAKDGIGSMVTALFGENSGESFKNSIASINAKVKEYAPKAIGNGMLFGALGLATGIAGPLVAALGGAAVSVAANSSRMQDFLFGEKITDAEGNESRGGGFISKEMQDTVKKYLPDMKAFGITGTVLGMLTPFGPLGGLMIGSGIAYAKKNERVHEMFFGDEDGLINKDRKKMIKDAFPNISAAVLGAVLLGPFGLLGNAVLGTGFGLLSSTDEFKDVMLGKPDKDGKRTGGVAGSIKTHFVNPLAKFASTLQTDFLGFIKKDILSPLKRAIAPIGRDIKDSMKWTFDKIGAGLNKLLTSALGVPFIKKLEEKLLKPIATVGKSIFKNVLKPVKFLASAPSKAIGWFGDKRRSSHIKDGKADYMSANERLNWRDEKGISGDKMHEFDSRISNYSENDLKDMHQNIGLLKDGTKFLDNEKDKNQKEFGSSVSDIMEGAAIRGGHGRDTFLKLAKEGKTDEAIKFLYSPGFKETVKGAIHGHKDLGISEKDKLAEMLKKYEVTQKEITHKQTNFKGASDEAFKNVGDKLGIKLDGNNIDNVMDLLSTEKNSRVGAAAEYNASDEQSKAITDNMDKNAKEVIDHFKIAIELLQGIKNGSDTMTDIQKADINNTVPSINNSIDMYRHRDTAKMHTRNQNLESVYGKDSLNDASKFALVDNEERYNSVHELGKDGYKFEDLNHVMGMDKAKYDELHSLARAGYDVRDHKKMDNISKHKNGYANIKAMAEMDYDFKGNHEAIAELNPKKLEYLKEMTKLGYNHDNIKYDDLMKRYGNRSNMRKFAAGNQIAGSNAADKNIHHDPTKEVFSKVDMDELIATNPLHSDVTPDLPHNAKYDKMDRKAEAIDKFKSDIKNVRNNVVAIKNEAIDTAIGVKDVVTDNTSRYTKKANKYKNKKIREFGETAGGITSKIKTRATDVKDNIVNFKNKKAEQIENAIVDGIHSYARGTKKVKKDQVAALSAGELIVPAKSNSRSISKKKAEILGTAKAEKVKTPHDDMKAQTKTEQTPNGPVEYVKSSDGSWVEAKTKDNADIDAKQTADKNVQKGMLTTMQSLSSNITGWMKSVKDKVSKKTEEEPWWQQLLKMAGVAAIALGVLPKINDAITSGTGIVSQAISGLGDLLKPVVKWVEKKLGVDGDDQENIETRVEGAGVRAVVRSGASLTEAGIRVAANAIEKPTSAAGKVLSYTADAAKYASGQLSSVGEGLESVGKMAVKSPAIAGIVEQFKSFFAGLFKKITGMNMLPKQSVGTAIKEVFQLLVMEIAETLPKKPQVLVKMEAMVATGGLFNLVDAAAGFISGYQDCCSILGISASFQPEAWMKLCTGIMRALNNLCALGLIPEKWIMNLLIDYVAPAMGVDVKNITDLRKQSEEEVANYNAESGTDYSVEQYNKKVKDDKTIFERVGDKIGDAYDSAKDTYNSVKDGVTTIGDVVSKGVEPLVEGINDIGSFISKVLQSKMQLISTGDVEENTANEMTIKEGDTLGGIKRALKGTIDSITFIPAALMRIGVIAGQALSPYIEQLGGFGREIVNDVKVDFGLAMAGDLMGMIGNNSVVSDGPTAIKHIVEAIPKMILTPVALISGAVNIIKNNMSPVISGLASVGSSIGNSVISMAKASLMGDYSTLFTLPEVDASQPALVSGIANIASIVTKVMLAPMAIMASPIGAVYSTISGLFTGLSNNFISDSEKARITSGEVPFSEIMDSSSQYWADPVSDKSGNPLSLLGSIGNKMYKLMMAPVVMFKSVFKSIGDSIDSVKNWFGEKLPWVAKFFSIDGKPNVTAPTNTNVATTDSTTSNETVPYTRPTGLGKYGRGIEDTKKSLLAKRAKQVQSHRNSAVNGFTPSLLDRTPAPIAMADTSPIEQIKSEVSTSSGTQNVGTYYSDGSWAKNDQDHEKNISDYVAGGYDTSNKDQVAAEASYQGAKNVDYSTWSDDELNTPSSKFKDGVDTTCEYINGISAKEIELNKRFAAKQNAKGKYGRSKFGRGGQFYSQLDPTYDMQFNSAEDSSLQTMKDSGCGPASASNIVSAMTGQQLDPRDAANYALKNGYKETDGGTKPDFFKKILSGYGIESKYENSEQGITNQLQSGNPVLLMGTADKVDSKTPFGTSPHYVVGTGIDAKGKMIVQDPESNSPDSKYNMKDVLNNTTIGMSNTLNASGKYGRGRNNMSLPNFGISKYGRGGNVTPQKMWSLANWVSQKTGLKPEFVYGQWYHESGGFSSQLCRENYNFGGMTQTQPNGEANKQPDGGNYYMQFDSPEAWAEYYAKYIVKYDGITQTKTVSDFSQNLKDGGYYGASVDEYINGVSSGIAQIPGGAYDKALVDASKLGKNKNTQNGIPATAQKVNSIFDAFSQMADDYYGPLKGLLTGAVAGIAGNTSTTAGNASASTNAGIRNASNWAQNLVDSKAVQPYGDNGCTAFTQDYLKHSGSPFANEQSLYCPDIRKQAMANGTWKDASQPLNEGDLVLVDTNGNMSESDGPDHAIIANRNGGFYSNSSSNLNVFSGDIGKVWGAKNVWGSVATGDAGTKGTIAMGDSDLSLDQRKAIAGPTSGTGKYGRGIEDTKKSLLAKRAKQVQSQRNSAVNGFTSSLLDSTPAPIAMASPSPIEQIKSEISTNSQNVGTYYSDGSWAKNDQDHEKNISDYVAGGYDTSNKDQVAAESAYQGARNVDYSTWSDDELNTPSSKFKDGVDTTCEYINGISSKEIELNKRFAAKQNAKGKFGMGNALNKTLSSGMGNALNKTPSSGMGKMPALPRHEDDVQTKSSKTGMGGGLDVIDYTKILSTIIDILITIATNTGKLNQVDKLLDKSGSKEDTTVVASTPQKSGPDALASIKSKLGSLMVGSKNGTGDMFMNKDTDYLLSAMRAIATD